MRVEFVSYTPPFLLPLLNSAARKERGWAVAVLTPWVLEMCESRGWALPLLNSAKGERREARREGGVHPQARELCKNRHSSQNLGWSAGKFLVHGTCIALMGTTLACQWAQRSLASIIMARGCCFQLCSIVSWAPPSPHLNSPARENRGWAVVMLCLHWDHCSCVIQPKGRGAGSHTPLAATLGPPMLEGRSKESYRKVKEFKALPDIRHFMGIEAHAHVLTLS